MVCVWTTKRIFSMIVLRVRVRVRCIYLSVSYMHFRSFCLNYSRLRKTYTPHLAIQTCMQSGWIAFYKILQYQAVVRCVRTVYEVGSSVMQLVFQNQLYIQWFLSVCMSGRVDIWFTFKWASRKNSLGR